MSEHSKFPIPPEEGPEQSGTGQSGNTPDGSLIERAVKAFDWSNMTPPPVPERIAGATSRPRPNLSKLGLAPSADEPTCCDGSSSVFRCA